MSEQYRIAVRLDSGRGGWIAEVFFRNGGRMLHVTAPQPTRTEAVALAKRWVNDRKAGSA